MSVCQRVCFHSVGFSSGVTATLWVTTEGILPLSGLQQRGYCHSLGYSRGDTATVCLSEGMLPLSWLQQRGHCLSVREYTPCTLYSISINIYSVYLYLSCRSLHMFTYIYIYLSIYVYYIHIYIYTYITYNCTYIFVRPTGVYIFLDSLGAGGRAYMYICTWLFSVLERLGSK